MRSWRRAASVVLALSALTFALTTPSATAGPGHSRFSFAVIGDIPYGDTQIADFPHVISQINADPDVRFVNHIGDIKNGSTVCSDDYFKLIKSDFDMFEDPLVYTVGDNEWTDCHRPNNGSYDPLDRLAAIREVFFPQPDRTLGRNSVRVTSQADQGYPEDVRYTRANVAFAALHIVGSNNNMAPWTGNTSATPEQAAEVLGRTAAVVQEIRETFAAAAHEHNKAVVLLTQADMFDPTVTGPSFADYYAFQPIVKAIAEESAEFRGPVYLFNGDSHVYNSDKPLDTGSQWLPFYGVKTVAPNLHRVTIDGSTDVRNWLKVTIDPGSKHVLSWTRVPFAHAN
ncbi:metallophosphoesterase [Streptomyces sp. NPDC057611]|uniref:metallophosphoesterase n=1 Tax=Streptomyces sp. NPDC057611 TaxID=3346182 RepID=UPI003684BD3C